VATALVAAGGIGERFGGSTPKALVRLAGRPLVAWCAASLGAAASVERMVVAAPPGFEREIAHAVKEAAESLEVEVVTGGPSRSRSVAAALASAGEADVIVVHDAARPLVTPKLIDRCVGELGRVACDGAVAAARATDTVKEADVGGRVIATLERSSLWLVQTPQVFRTGALREALAGPNLDRAYDDAQLVEARGGDVRIVEAPRENLKITTPLDLRIAELVVSQRGGY
jgi:2-C-methyl-D-erythritol 4-phosphate cytidylyltransferase